MSASDPKNGVGYAFGEKLPSGHVNTVWGQQPRLLDATNGGSYTLGTALTWTLGALLTINGASDIDFTGSGDLDIDKLAQLYNVEFDGQAVVNGGVNFEWLGTTNLPKIGTRQYVFTQPLIPMPTPNVGDTTGLTWNYASALGDWYQSNVGAAYEIAFPLTRLPNQGILRKVRVVVDGAGAGGANHGGTLPATLPKATLYRRLLTSTSVSTIGAQVTDNPVSAANYDTLHALAVTYNLQDGSGDAWTWTGLSELITSNAYHWIVINGETGANSVANALSVMGIECEFDCTWVAPG
jgi:hypothetical protein